MAEGGATRRLTTIVAADVAGYSRLMGTDEEATLAALRGHRKELIDPNIAEHGGRIANTAGDSILIEFPSVVEALRSAIDIQRGMAARNSEEPEDRRIAFRIGVNVGDVMEQDGDLLGDGVNVAARLEGLAEPGGICVSARVWEDVRDKLEIGFQDRGEQTLKNIARPVRVYRVLLDRAAAETGTAPPRPQSWLPWTAAVVVVLAILVGGLVWWQPWLKWLDPAPLSEADGIKAETAGTAAPSDKAALPLPDKPSVAVLPFQNISGDPEQTYFADGITEDIITDLSKLSGLFVIARNSSFRYRGGAHDLKQVGAELGVKFVLEGSVRRAGNTVRINAQLIEAATGGHLWAERYDGTLEDVFALQDKVTGAIVKALEITFKQGEEMAFGQHETENIKAYDEFLAGWKYFNKTTPADFKKAIAHFERAILLDANYARPHAALAELYTITYRNFWHIPLGYDGGITGRSALRKKRDDHLNKALIQPSALALAVEARRRVETFQFDKARATATHAIRLAPGAPDGYLALARVLTVSGEGEAAIRQMETAMRLQPHYPWSYIANLGTAYLIAKKYDRAATLLEEATRRNPESEYHIAMLAIAYAYSGQQPLAEKTVVRWREVTLSHGQPSQGSPTVYLRWNFKNEVDRQYLMTGLERPGAEDQRLRFRQ